MGLFFNILHYWAVQIIRCQLALMNPGSIFNFVFKATFDVYWVEYESVVIIYSFLVRRGWSESSLCGPCYWYWWTQNRLLSLTTVRRRIKTTPWLFQSGKACSNNPLEFFTRRSSKIENKWWYNQYSLKKLTWLATNYFLQKSTLLGNVCIFIRNFK